jgi:hypothetical protein
MSEEQWTTEDKRRDGLSIVAGIDGWLILPAEGRPAIDRCPCCDELFTRDDRGFRGARLVADMIYPLTEEARGDAN